MGKVMLFLLINILTLMHSPPACHAKVSTLKQYLVFTAGSVPAQNYTVDFSVEGSLVSENYLRNSEDAIS